MAFNMKKSLTLLSLWLLWVVFCIYVDLSIINKFIQLLGFFIIYFFVNRVFFPDNENYNKCTDAEKKSALTNFLCLVFLPIFGILVW